MIMVVYVNVRLNVKMHRIYQHHHIIVYQILFLILNDVLMHHVVNYDGISLRGLMYVSITCIIKYGVR
jgi:hypothetical protein